MRRKVGPRTPEGKATSSRNSLVHGMTSGKFLPPGADPGEFFQLLDQFRARFQPLDAVQTLLGWRLDSGCAPAPRAPDGVVSIAILLWQN
jgi:hypothetical protein